MRLVQIVFSFDRKIIMPAAVCMSSLMKNVGPDTFYNIYILYPSSDYEVNGSMDIIEKTYEQCSIEYIPVDSFASAYEVRGVTRATYFRLLIPELLPKVDKAIYSDVDVIFRMDLSEAFETNLEGYYLAATIDRGLNKNADYIKSLGIEKASYFQAGFIVMNLKKMREDKMVNKFLFLSERKFKYQDQDILNIACKGKIMLLPLYYNVNDCAMIDIYWGKDAISDCPTQDVIRAKESGNIHYSGYKPWKRYSVFFDIWWEYYRKSPVFDEQKYFKFFFDKTMLLDSLSLWKRLKILIRYFVYGRYKG